MLIFNLVSFESTGFDWLAEEGRRLIYIRCMNEWIVEYDTP